MEKNLRDLLFYYKHNKKPNEEYEKFIKDNLYDVVKENVEYFSRKKPCRLYYTISHYTLSQLSPLELFELDRRFNKAATGIFGLEFDNSTDVVLDNYGKLYSLSIYKNKNEVSISVYDILGTRILYSFVEKIDAKHISSEHLNELRKIDDYYNDRIEKENRIRERYEEIKKYSEYISVEHVSSGYAHMIKKITIDKNIPIKLSIDEIAKYADDWNYCFGGTINKTHEDENKEVYRVKIYTD